VGPRAGLDGCGKSRPPTRIRSPDVPARSEASAVHGVNVLHVSPPALRPGKEYLRVPSEMRG
jgi:hypothetical protein